MTVMVVTPQAFLESICDAHKALTGSVANQCAAAEKSKA